MTGLLVTILILPGLWLDYWLLVDPARAPLVEVDRWQYINGWPAGYGLPETANLLRTALLQSDEIIVAYDIVPSNIQPGLNVYLYEQRHNIIYRGFDFSQESPERLVEQLSLAHTIPVFIVLQPQSHRQLNVDFNNWPYAKLVAHFEKPGGDNRVEIYQAVR